ncbi:hypothetical protein GJ496_002416 [Pomphorhynchus laevis]|nr:hypothetical protein GJ496_002416 [Pomphorhynchus laevis]
MIAFGHFMNIGEEYLRIVTTLTNCKFLKITTFDPFHCGTLIPKLSKNFIGAVTSKLMNAPMHHRRHGTLDLANPLKLQQQHVLQDEHLNNWGPNDCLSDKIKKVIVNDVTIILGYIDFEQLENVADLLSKALSNRFRVDKVNIVLQQIVKETEYHNINKTANYVLYSSSNEDDNNATSVINKNESCKRQILYTLKKITILKLPNLADVRTLFHSLSEIQCQEQQKKSRRSHDALQKGCNDSSNIDVSVYHSFPVVYFVGQSCLETGAWLLADGLFDFNDLTRSIIRGQKNEYLSSSLRYPFMEIFVACKSNWQLLATKINVAVSVIEKQETIKSSRQKANSHHEDALVKENMLNLLKQYYRKYLNYHSLMRSTIECGILKFSAPTLYMFSSGTGTCSLFGIQGLTVLINGGYDVPSCFWNFVKHLERLDIIVLSSYEIELLRGLNCFFNRKILTAAAHCVSTPHIGALILHRDLSAYNSKCTQLLRPKSLEYSMDIEIKDLLRKAESLGVFIEDLNNVREKPITLYSKTGHGILQLYRLIEQHQANIIGTNTITPENTSSVDICSSRAAVAAQVSHQRSSNKDLERKKSIILTWLPSQANKSQIRILFPSNTTWRAIVSTVEHATRLYKFLRVPQVHFYKRLVDYPISVSRQYPIITHDNAVLTTKGSSSVSPAKGKLMNIADSNSSCYSNSDRFHSNLNFINGCSENSSPSSKSELRDISQSLDKQTLSTENINCVLHNDLELKPSYKHNFADERKYNVFSKSTSTVFYPQSSSSSVRTEPKTQKINSFSCQYSTVHHHSMSGNITKSSDLLHFSRTLTYLNLNEGQQSAYFDLVYVPIIATTAHIDKSFFEVIRSLRYFIMCKQSEEKILSTLDALLEGRRHWKLLPINDTTVHNSTHDQGSAIDYKFGQISIIPSHSAECIRNWSAVKADCLAELNVIVQPAADSCSINFNEDDKDSVDVDNTIRAYCCDFFSS